MGNPASPRMEEQRKPAEMYNPPLQNMHYGNTFVTKEDRSCAGNVTPSDTQLERELFMVLGDLERTLVKEQSDCGRAPSSPSYGSSRPFRSRYSSERGLNNIFGDRNVYSQSSGAYYPDGTRTLKPNEEFKSHSTYRPQRFFEMYSNRHHTAPKQGYFQRQMSNESPPMSPVNSNRSFSSSNDLGKFSFSNWSLPFLRHSSFGFLNRGNPKDSKRTSISEIVWNSPPPSSPDDSQALRAQSLMDLSNAKEDLHRKSSHPNTMYEFYRSQQNVFEAAGQKGSQISTVPPQEVTRHAPGDHSASVHSLYGMSGLAQPTQREIPYTNIVPMQTDDAWDEVNKENCLDTDPYDSDATIHSSDTLSDNEMEVIETGIEDQPATEPTFSGTGLLPSQQTHPSLAKELSVQQTYSHPGTELIPQYEYSNSDSEITLQHEVSTHVERATQNQYSSPAVEFTLQHKHQNPAADVSQHKCTSRAAVTLSSQTSATQLHTQPVHSVSAVLELQLKHGHQHSTVANEQQTQHGSLNSACTSKHQSEYGYPPLPDELTFQAGNSLSAEDNLKPQNPSSVECSPQHGYPFPTELHAKHSYPPPTELPAKHGYPPPTELPANHGYPPPTELPAKHGYPPPTDPPAKHGYPPPTDPPAKYGYPPPTELPAKHGYLPPTELPAKHGYLPPTELPAKHGYPPPTELPAKHGYPLLTELPAKHGYPPPTELLAKHGYLPPTELPSKHGHPPPTELPAKHGYLPPTELPAKHGYPPPTELPAKHGYPPPTELPANHGYPPPTELPAKHDYPPPTELPAKHGYPPPTELPAKYGYSPLTEPPAKHGYPLPTEPPAKHGYLPPTELPAKHGYLPPTELPAKHGYSLPTEPPTKHGCPPPTELPAKPGYLPPTELPAKHGYTLPTEPPTKHGCPPPTELPAKPGYPPPTELPAKHGYPPSTELPAKHGYPPPTELPVKHGYPPPTELPAKHGSPPPTERPAKHGYSPLTEPPAKHDYPLPTELPAKHGYLPPTELPAKHGYLPPTELPAKHGYPSLNELPSKHGYTLPTESPTKHGCPPPTELPAKPGYPPPTELLAKHGYPPPTELSAKYDYPPPPELCTKHGNPPPTELPAKHGYPQLTELPAKHGYPPPTEPPAKPGYPPPTELPAKHGYPPPTKLPAKHGYSPPTELPAKYGYPPLTELPAKYGYPPPTELPAKHGYPLPEEHPKKPVYPPFAELPKQGFQPPVVLPAKESSPLPPVQHGYTTTAFTPVQNGYPPSHDLPFKSRYPAVQIASQDSYPPPSLLPAKHGSPSVAGKHTVDELSSEDEFPRPASGEIPSAQDSFPQAASFTGTKNIRCDSGNTAIKSLFVNSSLSGTNNASSNIYTSFSSCSPSASTNIIKALSDTPLIVGCARQAESAAEHNLAETITTFTSDFKPQLSHKKVSIQKTLHTHNIHKAGNLPSTTSAQQDDQQSSVSSTYHIESIPSNSSAVSEDNNLSKSSTPSAVGLNLSSGLQYPAFSRTATTTKTFQMRVFSIASSLGSEDQTKYSAVYRHPQVLPQITPALKQESLFQSSQGAPQTIPDSKPAVNIHHEIDNDILCSSEPISNANSCKKTPLQMFPLKSNADVHGSLPDISSTHDSLVPKNTERPTSDCESIAPRTAGKKAGRYTSILLHASSLPNLGETQSFPQKSSEVSDLETNNLKLTISASRNGSNNPIKKQDTLILHRHGMIDDSANNPLAQVTKPQYNETKERSQWESVEKHEELGAANSENLSFSAQNPPTIFPAKNTFSQALEISYINSLESKDSNMPEVKLWPNPFRSVLSEGLSDDQKEEQKITLKKDPSGSTHLTPNANHQNGSIQFNSSAVQDASFTTCRVDGTHTDPTFISVTNANINENLNSDKCRTTSNVTHRILYPNIKVKSELTVMAGVSNGLHTPKFSEDQAGKLTTSENLVSASGLSRTEDKAQNATHLSDPGQAAGHKNKTAIKIHVQPIHQVAGYDCSPANKESKPADTKTSQPPFPMNSFSVLADLPGENNAYSSESRTLNCTLTNRVEPINSLKPSTSNRDFSHCDKSGFPDTLTSQRDLVLTTPVCDSSVKPLSTNITVIHVKPNLPRRRLLGDHLHVYTTKQRVSPVSSNKQNASCTLARDQTNTAAAPLSIKGDGENFREKEDLSVSHEVKPNGDQTGAHKNGQIHTPDAPSEAQSPENLPFHHSNEDRFTSSDSMKPGKTLKEYKTKSSRSFVATEDKIEYRELVSVYYSLPRRHSKPLSVASTAQNILSPHSILNKKQEFHVDLANTTYPILRLLYKPQSSEFLSDVTNQENVYETNSTARRMLTRSTSWDESETNTNSPGHSHPVKDVSPTIPWNVNDTFSPDEMAYNPSGSDRYTYTVGSSSDQVAAKSAAITDDEKHSCLKLTNNKEGEYFYLRPPLNTSPSLEKGKSFVYHSTRMHPFQRTDLEHRQDIAQEKEDYNQNIVQEQLVSGTDNKLEHGNKLINAKHFLNQSCVNNDEKAFPYRSEIQTKLMIDQTGHPFNRWDGILDSGKSHGVDHPASDNAFSKGRSLSDSDSNYPHPTFNPLCTTVDNNSTVLLQDEQKTTGRPISSRKQLGKELVDLQKYTNLIEGCHALYPKEQVVDTTPEQIASPTIENVNTYTSYETTDNVCEPIKNSYEPYNTIDWEQIYKISSRRNSDQDARQRPSSPSVTLQRRQSDSYVHLNKRKTRSSPTSPLQSLTEDRYHSQISPDYHALLLIPDKSYAPLVGSHKPVSPTGGPREENLKNTHTKKENPCRIKRSGSEPTRKLTNQSPAFMYKSFPDEKVKNKNPPKLSSTFESPEESDFPSPAHDWLFNHSRMPDCHDVTLMPFAEDNRNVFTDTSFQKSVSPEQNYFLNDWDRTPLDQNRHVHRSKSLKNLNLHNRQTDCTDTRDKSGRRFSTTTNVDKAYGRNPSSPTLAKAFKYNRKFWSHSELMSTDENDNWDTCGGRRYRQSRSYSTSPTVGFGIFGKEQQLAFLENIKRSLTEGRLWRPCYLKNPGFLKREADNPTESTALPISTFDANTITVQGMPPRQTLNIYRDDPVIYSSDSDSDTTTDDEYYLDEFDKESEL